MKRLVIGTLLGAAVLMSTKVALASDGAGMLKDGSWQSLAGEVLVTQDRKIVQALFLSCPTPIKQLSVRMARSQFLLVELNVKTADGRDTFTDLLPENVQAITWHCGKEQHYVVLVEEGNALAELRCQTRRGGRYCEHQTTYRLAPTATIVPAIPAEATPKAEPAFVLPVVVVEPTPAVAPEATGIVSKDIKIASPQQAKPEAVVSFEVVPVGAEKRVVDAVGVEPIVPITSKPDTNVPGPAAQGLPDWAAALGTTTTPEVIPAMPATETKGRAAPRIVRMEELFPEIPELIKNLPELPTGSSKN